MKLLLIRHPAPQVPKGLCYGRTDVPLLDGWVEDAEAIKRWLETYYPSAVWQSYHSPLTRAASLAQQVFADSKTASALAELDFGAWENVCWSDIPKHEIDRWGSDLVNATPYHGESLAQLSERVMTWLEPIVEANQNTVLFTHAGVIKVLIANLCHIPIAQCYRLSPTYSSITELEVGDGYAMLHRFGAGDWTK